MKEVKKTFQVPATLEGISPLKDGGMSVRFHTNEVTNAEKVVLMDFYQKFGFLLFKENEFSDKDIPTGDAKLDGKTPSQRLRGVMYVYYSKKDGKPEGFDRWRRQYLEGQIEKFKDKINELEK